MQRSLLVRAGLFLTGVAGVVLTVTAQSADDVGKIVAQDVEAIEAGLNKPKLDKKTKNRIRIAAVLIAAAAEDNEALQKAALNLGQAAAAEKVDDAKKLAATIKAGVKGGKASAKVNWSNELELELVMRAFSGDRVGGYNLEKILEEASEVKGAVDADLAAKTLVAANKTAVIAKLLDHYTPEKDEGKKTKKAWQGYSAEMKTAALETAAAARAKNGPALASAAQKLSTTCTKCHDVFR